MLLALTWSTIGYGAALSGVAAAVLVFLFSRRTSVAVAAGLGAALGPLAWNAILHDVGGKGFFHDVDFKPVPASWQDTGSGVFALAAVFLLLSLGPWGRIDARRVAGAAILCALAAFFVDVYLY
jgi:hypothetical protein